MKENDIRPADLFAQYLELSAQDARAFFSKSPRQPIPCPACDREAFEPAFTKLGFDYVTCAGCGTLYQSPRPPEADFEKFYAQSPSAEFWAKTFFPAVAEARREHLFRPKVLEVSRLCERSGFRPQSVVDVGAGYGLFLEEWLKLDSGARAVAIEPHGDQAEVCRRKGLEVQECFANQATALSGQMDLAVSLEVLEHAYSPLAFCQSIYELLRPGGRALLTTLTVTGFDIQLLWERSKSVSPPHHLNFLSVVGAERLLERAGFAEVEVFTPGKLDVDIVKNALEEDEILRREARFARTLIQAGEAARNAFQRFLSDNRLSSHCWIWARK